MDDERYDDLGDEVRYTTHPKAVAGIVAMASIMVFWMIFGIALVLIGIIVPPDTSSGVVVYDPVLADYVTTERVLGAAFVSAVITGLSWTFVD